jgi:hypothetical protein
MELRNKAENTQVEYPFFKMLGTSSILDLEILEYLIINVVHW